MNTTTTGQAQAAALAAPIDFDVFDEVLESWIADQALTAEQQRWIESCLATPLDRHACAIANGHYCEELDLPRGSTVIEVLASLLDGLQFRQGLPPQHHLAKAQTRLQQEAGQ